MDNRLYRSTTNKFIGGVCGGLGEYLRVDPTFVRLVVAILTLVTNGVVLLAYIIGWIIIPLWRPGDEVEAVREDYRFEGWRRYLPGLLLIAIGALLLMRWHVFWLGWGDLWPVLLILLGLVFILRGTSRRTESHNTHVGHRHSDANNGGPLT